jgi:DNA-directed RNA polymerase specialized sigma24 family protein
MMTTTKLNNYQIYDILKSYHWKIREIKRIDEHLEETDFKGVAQYGIEATLPTGKGVVGRALENEIIRRDKKSKRLMNYIEEVNFINDHLDKIKDEKEKVVLDCMLDGMSITAISKHMGISRRHVHKLQDKLVETLGE